MINPVALYQYLVLTMYLFMADTANSDLCVCVCVVIGLGFVSTSPAFNLAGIKIDFDCTT